MKVVVMRSLSSKVLVKEKIVGQIKSGLVLLVGFTHGDSKKEIDYMVNKIINLRIFEDENEVMNKSILDQTNKEILSISQFTLYGNAKKGSRPSYIEALNSNEALKLYELFNETLKKHVHVETGIFGADMECHITNDGPVTIILEKESKDA